MRHKLVTLLVIVALSLMLAQPLNYWEHPHRSVPVGIETDQMTTSSYTFHSPIRIDTNQNFTDQGWPGEGSKEEPFVIEGYNITTDESCITVTDTDVYFIIRNCYLSSISGNSIGVNLTDVGNGTIDSCIIEGTTNAVHLYSSSECVVQNTTIRECSQPGVNIQYSSNCNVTSSNISNNNPGFGIYTRYSSYCNFDNNSISECNAGIVLSASPNCVLSNNTLSENRFEGISLGSASQSLIINNTIKDNQRAAVTCGSDYSTFTNNSISNNGELGVFISLAMHCNFTGNILVNDSFLIWNSQHVIPDWTHSFSDNTVNGKPVVQFAHQSDLDIDASSFGEVILFNCTNSTVRDGSFSTSTVAVELGFCDGCKIVNSSFSNQKKRGIFIQDSPNTMVSNSIFEMISEYVIDMRYSPESMFCNNTVTDTSDIAVFIRDSIDCIVSFNNISSNHEEGVWLDGSSNCTVVSNTLHSNGNTAFRLFRSDDCRFINNTIRSNARRGIYVDESNNCLLDNNTISMNDDYGVEILDSLDCIVINNTITLNYGGIRLGGSQNITIVDNSIGENSRGGISLSGSLECVIENNTIDDGLCLWGWGPLLYCLHNISGNIVDGKDLAYLVGLNDSQIDGSLYGQVILVNCHNVTVHDGLFVSVMVGVELLSSTNCTVTDNEILSSGLFGMYCSSSEDCIITNNTITDGVRYGLHLEGGTSNFTIYDNVIGWNGLWNAWDDGTDNHWNSSMNRGNYWGNYNGTGIYEISSNIEISYDYHPQKADIDNPVIEPLSNIDYIEASSNNVITWVVSDLHPKLFTIYSNGTKVHEGIWDGLDIVYPINGLTLGVYNYSIIVYDTCFNYAQDSLLVLVRDGTFPMVDSPPDVSYTEGETGHSIIWDPEDQHPQNYSIYLDEVLMRSGEWNSSGEQISFSVDGFAIGSHNVTLVLTDIAGNSIIDIVFVTVIDPTTSTPTTPSTTATPTTPTTNGGDTLGMVVLLLGSIGVGVVIVVFLLYQKRK